MTPEKCVKLHHLQNKTIRVMNTNLIQYVQILLKIIPIGILNGISQLIYCE